MSKQLVSRQVSQGLYSPVAYALSVMAINLPMQLISSTFLGTILYFFAYYSQTADRWAFWVWALFLHELCMNSLFRLFAYVAPTLPLSTSFAGAGTGLMLIFGGFIITKSNLQNYALGAYYLSPFSWIVRSLVINEFGSSDYDAVVRGPNGLQRTGDIYLGEFIFLYGFLGFRFPYLLRCRHL